MTRTISREQLQAEIAILKPAPVLIEALPEKYFLDGHLPGALHLPHDQVRRLALRLLPDKGAAIVAYCASKTCQNSHIAAETLRAMGYTSVRVYAEGKQDWIEAGLPIEKGPGVHHAARPGLLA
ncbi:MAG: rhodanese-like domain-containing protein [Hyphomicrobiaceae bacterium]|nr:MAG: rhodanese-like domain-containing protein [Hyphomicrobiaceae bacterium]